MGSSDTNYRLLFEYATEGVFVTDETGTYLDANRLGLSMIGYELDELRGMTMRDLVVPSELDAAPLRFGELRAGQLVVSRRWLQRKDGSQFLAEISARQLPDGRILGLVRDVTSLWRTEHALRESEERYRNLVEGSPLGILIFQGGRIVFANRTMASILGYDATELVRMPPEQIPELVHPDDRAIVFDRIRSRLAGEDSPSRYEFRAVTRSGELRWLEINSSRVEFDGTAAIQTTAADITDRKRVENELIEREEYYRSLIENASDAFLVQNLDRSRRYVSPTIEPLTGYTPEEFLELPTLALADPDDIPRIEEAMRAIEQSPSTTRVVRCHLRHRDGSWRQVEATGQALRERGQVTGIVVTIRDITDRLALEQQLAQSQKMEAVGRLAGGVAHDFNNMLTVILAECSILGRNPAEPEAHVDEIVGAAERSAALIRQLLAFSRRQVVRPTVFRASNALADITAMLERALGEEVSLELDFRDHDALVSMDRVQLEQVIVNLAVNARDAMPDGGTVRIVTEVRDLGAGFAPHGGRLEPGRYVALSVIDDGVGMPEEVRQRVFEPFFTTKANGKGTGLGLATCYGIVTRFGGSIALHSEPGTGTRVEILLPIEEAAHAPDTPSSVE